MAELPEEDIEAAEDVSVDHSHENVGDDADGMLTHICSDHHLDAPQLSGSTLHGLHDRLHHETGAGTR